jgi:outer membrane protein TolC
MIRARLPGSLVLLLSLAYPARAQPGGPARSGQQAPEPPPLVLAPRVGVTAPPRTVTLGDVIRLTLEQNNDVSIARLEADAARQDVRAALGVFDPRLVPALTYQRIVSPSTSTIGGGINGRVEQSLLGGTLQLAGRAPWAGGRFTADFTSSRTETSNVLSRLNPQFPSSLGASYVQPLGRGRTIDADRRQILFARRAADLTDAQLTQIVMDQLTLVEEAYWNLAFAARNLEVQAQALAQAQGQVASNERQAREGTLAPIDVVEAQIQVANFRQTVASAQQALTEAENRLKTLMLSDRQAGIWNQALVPGDLADRAVPSVTLPGAVQLALSRRPELAALATERAQNDIDRRYYKDLAKPQVNLAGTYTMAGLAGEALTTVSDPLSNTTNAAFFARLNELAALAGLRPLDPPSATTNTVPGFLDGGYGSSIRNLLARRFPTLVVQLQMDLPLVNSTARANIARTEIAGAQIERRRRQLEQAIEAEVRNTLQAVQSSETRLEAAASARRNALEQYESERRRFESGLGTVFLVLQRQTALVTAQAQELRARADLNQAVSLFDRAVGGTLERHGVKLSQ